MTYHTYPGLTLPIVNTQLAKASGTYVLSKKSILKEIYNLCKTDSRLEKLLKGQENTYNNAVLLMYSKSRNRLLVNMRACYFYWVRTMFGPTYSLVDLGVDMGCRDHSTVIHGLKLYQDLLFSDKPHQQMNASLSSIFKPAPITQNKTN
jgi:chromosomal replication initiation ATPase DnaA